MREYRPNSLVQQDVLLHREYFKEALAFYGIDAMYYQKKGNSVYNPYGEMSNEYYEGKETRVIFQQVPTVHTMKKLGWAIEMDTSNTPIVDVRWDLPELQVGCLFSIRDPLNTKEGRLFRVMKMSVGIIYPASVTCLLVPIVGKDVTQTLQPENRLEEGVYLEKTLDPSLEL